MLLSSGPGRQTSAHLCSLLQLLSRWTADTAPQLSAGSWLACKGPVEQGEGGLSSRHLHDTGTPGAVTQCVWLSHGARRGQPSELDPPLSPSPAVALMPDLVEGREKWGEEE